MTAEPSPGTTPEAAALTLASGALSQRLRDLRAALILPVETGGLAVRYTIGFAPAMQEQVATVRLDPEWLAGGVIRNPNHDLGQALQLRDSAVVPLSHDEPLSGALLVDAPRLTPTDIGFVCRVADLLAGTLSQQQHVRAVRGDADLARRLLRLSAEITSTSPIHEVLHRISEAVVEIVPCNRSSVLMWSERRGAFVPAADVGTPADVAAHFAASEFQFGYNIPFENDLKAGRTVRFDTSTQDLAIQRLLHMLQLGTLVIVPLARPGRMLGALTASWSARHPLTDFEHSLLQALGRYAAVAIDSARLFNRADKGAQVRDALSQLSLTVHSMRDPDQIHDLACRRLRELFRTDVSFFAKRSHRTLVITHADSDSAEQLIGTAIDANDPDALVATAWREGRPVVSHDAGAAARLPEGFPVRSLAAVPLFGGQTPFGVFALADTRPYRFNRDMVDEVAMAAIIIGSAVENANLLEELRRNAGVLADRTARLEEHSAALESRNQEMQDLLFIASHDLRAPLINIEGFVHELERGVDELTAQGAPRAADLKEPMEFVRRGVSRMTGLLKAMAHLSDLAGNPLERAEVDLEALARRLQQRRREDLAAAGAELTIHPLGQANGDATRLAQALEHLVDNAIRYMGEAPRREIDIGRVESPDGYRYYVCDSGPGMSPEEIEVAFRLFRRGAQRGPGTGLGLTLVKKIIEKHGGRVWLKSQPGQGTTVWFTLPAPRPDDGGTAAR